ncbi:ABC transporter A, ABCA, partial [Kipferlia bialata]|eukprot:g14821.t1
MKDSVRTRALLMDSMDEDVEAERRLMSQGLDPSTPLMVCNLEKNYRRFCAVRDVSFHIEKGVCMALLGPNGAGKTTAMSMITGVLGTSGGTTLVRGYDVQKQPDEVHKDIGLCPQHDVFFPSLSVRDHLLCFARIRGVPRSEE